MKKNKKPSRNLKNKPARVFFLALAAVVFLVLGCQNQRAGRQFERGQNLHSQGSYLEAIRSWETVLNNWPKSKFADQALHRIGTTYYVELDQQDRARDAFLRLVKDYPGSSHAPEDQILVAEIFRRERQYAKALVEYYRFLNLFPDHPRAAEVSYHLVTCLFEVGEYNALRVQAENLISKYPSSPYTPDCIFWIGESYYLQKDNEKARANFTDYLKKYPQGQMAYKAWLSMARSYEDDGYLKDAIKIYQELQARHPSDKIIRARLDSAQKRYQQRFGSEN